MRCACIDIGSNTTALLVADVDADGVHPVGKRRAFTLIGSGSVDGVISAEKLLEVQAAVSKLVEYAKHLEAECVEIVATHVVRRSKNRDALAKLIESETGVPMRVLSTHEEAQYSFAGATGGRQRVDCGTVVIDAGGGSTEIAYGGTGDSLITDSFAVGSASVQSEFMASDPPTQIEVDRARDFVTAAFARLKIPDSCVTALAVGGGASTARELVGGLIDRPAVDRVLSVACDLSAEDVADRFEIEWHRSRLMPAGLIVLGAISEQINLPLEVGLGGLREGVVLGLADRD